MTLLSRKAIVAGSAAALLVAAAGCSDDKFLTEEPFDFVGPTNFYQNAGDAVAAVNGVYASLENTTGTNYYGGNFVMLVEFPTETITPYLSAGNERSQVDNYTFSPSHAYIYATWNSAYAAINRANAAIGRIPGISMDAALRDRLVGEAKFLRGLNYFNLVRLFGDVPLFTTETESIENLQQARTPAAQVYARIVADLTDAIKVLPKASAYGSADVGRASRGAAKTLLAKVYLQRAATGGQASDYQSALTLLKDVDANEGYSLVSNFSDLFDQNHESNSEVIFDIQCTRAPGLGCRLSNQFAPRNSNYGPSQNGSFTAESVFYAGFKAGDRRTASTFQLSFTNKSNATVSWDWTQSASKPYGADTPYMGKFLDRQSVGYDENNYIILRYADNLLMESEVVNEISGPTADAYAGVNAVRNRAGIGNLAPGLSKGAFKDSVFAQRRMELNMEGPNGYFDSQRNWAWAKARVEQAMALGAATKFKTSKYPKAQTTIDDRFKLMPIPQRARDLNPALTQNPGW